jgi:2-polyprenyl-3-methyl-5-hydroxy-6-metoxy-1,4-benzoquinol methylase
VTSESAVDPHREEIEAGQRFAFGANWARFLNVLDESRIEHAEASLKAMLRLDTLAGQRFLDAGSGSGLFSLAARRLGATVYSFDYDPESVACTTTLKQRFFSGDAAWVVERGSVLDTSYLAGLGEFDIVYSWGVLHHTGAMWQALENVGRLVKPGGQLFVAIYNDEGLKSRYWHAVKKAYSRRPLLRWPLLLIHLAYPFLPSLLYRVLTGRMEAPRGMSFWHDVVDWVGGFPFEVAAPGAIERFYRARGFDLENLKTTRRSGCNEFVLVRNRTA